MRSGIRCSRRVYGPELMARACARAASTGQRFYLYGGRDQGALFQLALRLRQSYPGIKIVGGYSPPHRPLTPVERAEVVDAINAARPDVVWVGIGVPKQEKWMAEMRPLLDAPVLVGVGAAFDFHAGLVPAGAEPASRTRGSNGPTAWRMSHAGCGVATSRYNPRFVAAFARQLADAAARARAGADRPPRHQPDNAPACLPPRS